jgi:hypothetical protein
MSTGAGVVRFDLSPVFMLCLFHGSSEGIAGFHILVQVRVRSLKAAALPFSSVQMLPVIHGFWLGNVRTVNCGDNVIDALIDEAGESQNIFQSVLAKQSCSLAFASSDPFCIERVTGTSCFSLQAGIRP